MHRMKKTSTLPDQILEKFDDLQFEQVTAAELNNFTITGIDGEGLGCITLCGLYPLLGTQLYVFNIYQDEENAFMQFQRAMVH